MAPHRPTSSQDRCSEERTLGQSDSPRNITKSQADLHQNPVLQRHLPVNVADCNSEVRLLLDIAAHARLLEIVRIIHRPKGGYFFSRTPQHLASGCAILPFNLLCR